MFCILPLALHVSPEKKVVCTIALEHINIINIFLLILIDISNVE